MNRLKELRIERNMSMAQAARELNIPYTTYVSYEKEEREPNSEMLIMLSNFFSCSVDYLIGKSNNRIDDNVLDIVNEIDNDILKKCKGNLLEAITEQKRRNFDNILPIPQMKKVPLLGTIACGEPIIAEENIEDIIDMPPHIHADFALKCKGDSMIGARILNGDIVYIHHQPDVENGEIAAVLIDDEATLKRIYKYNDMVVLRPENPAYSEMVYKKEEMNHIKIIGKAVGFYSNIK